MRPEYQNCAVNAVAVNHVMRGSMEMGIQRAETGPQLESNHKILSQWNMFSPKQHKRRRCLDQAAVSNSRPAKQGGCFMP